jgi:hypothetical protein
MVYLIIDGVEITSEQQLEEVITNFSEESKISLRLIFNEALNKEA